MEEKENVYLQETQTGAGAEAPSSAESECAVKEASTVLGKFKDVDALARAYSSLQAEFTRRSQKLKELERETGRRNADKGESNEDEKAEKVAEKLRKNAKSVREEGKKFSSFVAEIENSATEKTEDGSLPDGISVAAGAETKQETEGAASAFSMGDTSVAIGREDVELSADELYDKANRNEQVRLKIIGEYLNSLTRTGAPIMRGGATTLAAPPLKAKSVDEAGNMALRFFKNGGQA